MIIEQHPKFGIMLYAADQREQALLGQLVMNVRTHGYWAADLIEGEITIEPFNFPPIGTISKIPEATCTAEIAGFKPRRPDPVPEPTPEFINGVAI